MNDQGSLSGISVDHSEHWRLMMRIGPDTLHTVLYSPMHDGSLIHRALPLDPAAPTKLKALEACIYDNQLLLGDFSRISCVIECRETIILPPGLGDATDGEADDARQLIFSSAFPAFAGATFLSPSGMTGTAVMAGTDADMLSFIRRTFFNVQISSHLSPLCRYFLSAAGRSSDRRLYAVLRQGATDIVATDRGRLMMANTFDTPEPSDAAYFILAVRQMLGLPDSAETMLAGSAGLRELVTPILRRFPAPVMPVIFPSLMFRAGKDALNAPFDLIILPLCE